LKAYYDGDCADEVTAQSVQAFLADLGKKGFSRRSVQLHRDVLNMIFNNAIVEGKLTFNPCTAVQMPRNLPTSKRELPEDAAIEAVKRGAGQPFGLFALVCLYGGLRRGEALALRFEDIDRDKRTIRVNKAVEYIGNNPRVKGTKTAAGDRVVPLLAPLTAALPDQKSGLVFPREDGGPLTKTQYRKRWLRYCEAIGHEITAHQLRHGYATILYEAGIADKDAQELLGHSSIAVTRDVYTHIRSSRRTETAARLNAFVCSSDCKTP
jgi:integrase